MRFPRHIQKCPVMNGIIGLGCGGLGVKMGERGKNLNFSLETKTNVHISGVPSLKYPMF